MPARRIVGIDLGTTHTVVAEAPVDGSRAPALFAVPGLVGPGEIAAEPLFPSFLYAPLEAERIEDRWGDAPWAIGSFARRRGQQVPSRLVSSAKSWLSHARVDRTAAILPWAATDETGAPKLSPVEASARILGHVRAAYDAAHPDAPLAEQRIVLTVPASFDQSARELTVQAAAGAGLSVRLLEEPQAAFYEYLRRSGTERLSALARERGEAHVLVCDVGGGTTDLALIRIAIGERGVALSRVAVGRHLLLGGDNMDLAIAHHCEARLVEQPERLHPAQFTELVLACRSAKERLLGADSPESVPIRIARGGSSLVGNTLATELLREDVERLVLDGFLPDVEPDEKPAAGRGGLVGFGLPYERDAAITRHLAAFLERHALESGPDAVLFNGGIFRSPRIRARLLEALGRLTGRAVEPLVESDPDLAVALGAVGYGLALDGHGIRIAGGAARGYYVGLAGEARRAVCVVPRGAEEGERHLVASQPLALVVGAPVRFELYSSDRRADAPGTVAAIDPDAFDELPPVAVLLEGSEDSGREVRVQLEGELTPVGTLELACVEIDGGRRHRLVFEVRAASESEAPRQSRRAVAHKLDAAKEAIARVFGKGRTDVAPREVKGLVRELERILGDRGQWTIEENRALFDEVADDVRARRRSADHERVFWMLAGFCLRPGYGHPLDEKRVAKIAHLLNEGLVYKDESRGWQQFWIAWRRIAGGLGDKTQAALFRAVEPFVAPEDQKRKKPKNFRPQGLDEMLVLVSSLERLPAERRAELGEWFLERTWTSRDPRLWAAIGRIGSRVPTYASVHHVVKPSIVEGWLDHLLREKWEEMPSAPRAALAMARITGDRARDVSPRIRAEVEKRLAATGTDPEWQRAVRELVPVEEHDRVDFFGEGLPVGLKLVTADG